MNIELPLPANIALIVLGALLISLLVREWVNILRALTKRKIPYPKKLVSRVFLVGAGFFFIGLGFYLQWGTSPDDDPPVTCAYAGIAESDNEAIRWLIQQESDAVVSRDMELIKKIFAINATIIEYRNGVVYDSWNSPVDRYQELFFDATYLSAQNREIKSIAISGDTAYYTSGSEGTLITDGQTSDYSNPGGNNHWTLKKIDGCWRIFKFEINATGKSFP